MFDMFWRTDAECRCTWVSDTFCSFVGREREDLLGVGWAEHVHQNDRDRVWAEVKEKWAIRLPFLIHYWLRRHDDVYVYVRVYAKPWPSLNGEFEGYWGEVIVESTPARAEDRAVRANTVKIVKLVARPVVPALLVPHAPEVGVEASV